MGQKQIKELLKKDTVLESYDELSDEVQNNIKEVEKIFMHNSRKDIIQLQKQRKRLRAQYEDTENVYNDIKEAITDKIKENRTRRIIKVAQQNRIKRRQWKKNL